MSFLQKLLQRGRNGADPLRESAAMTTVYLQEQNKRFEAFVQEKIAELESVVSGLEARAATVATAPAPLPDVTPAAVDEEMLAAALPDEQTSVALLTPDETAPAEDDLPPEEQTSVPLPTLSGEVPATTAEPLPDTAAGYSLLNEQPSVSLLTPEETAPAEDDLPPDESPEEWQRFLGVGPKGAFE